MNPTIYQSLTRLKPGEHRKAEAVRLIEKLQHYGDRHIPPGYSQDHSERVIKLIEQDRSFFDRLHTILGNDTPPILDKLKRRFERNLTHMKQLSEMCNIERYMLPTHETFPFYDDFEHHTKARPTSQWGVSIRDIKFEPNFIAKGGFACVYRVEDKDGKKYALKLFKPTNQIPEYDLESAHTFRQYIFENVTKRRDLFSEAPFTALRAITSPDESPAWYLMDYFDGDTVGDKIEYKEKITDDKEMTKKIIVGYAEMLKKLHGLGLVFMDNNWDSVLVNETGLAICDFDLVIEADNPHIETTTAYHRQYQSKEIQTSHPPTHLSERESFALMIDHLFFGKSIINQKNQIHQKKLAEKNRRTHHKARREKLPRNMQQVVTPLINLPRDESITLDDFIEAAKLDLQQ